MASVRITPTQDARLKAIAKAQGKPVAAIVRQRVLVKREAMLQAWRERG